MEVAAEGMVDMKHKLYYEEDDHYVEEIRVRQLPESGLPDWAKQKLNRSQETQVTDEMQNVLQMKL